MAKKMALRRADVCAACGSAVLAGREAWWDAKAKTVTCTSCRDGGSTPTTPAPPPTPEAEEPAPTHPPDRQTGSAGRSARKEYERRSAKEAAKNQQRIDDDRAWREATVERRPVLGRVATALTPKPTIAPERQTTTAWKVGAEGEERVAEVLATATGVEVLHDRRIPGTRANIDHLVVGPAGVFVIDAKKYKADQAIDVRDVGGIFRTDERLYLGGRDRTKLVDAMTWQIDLARAALGDEFPDVPVHGVLCFIGATWGWRRKRKKCRGVIAVWPLGLPDLVTTPGPHTAQIEAIATHLRTALPPA